MDVAGTNALPGEPDALFVHSGLYGAYLGRISRRMVPFRKTVATTAGQQYLVSFWLTSVADQNGATTPNDFAASWNGSTLYAQTNRPLSVGPTCNSSFPPPAPGQRLEFDFNDVPGAFGLDDVSVEPVPPPVFQSVAVTHGAITFTWSAIANLSYQIQSAPSSGDLNWTNVAAPITATGTVMSASEPITTTPQQFYRIIVLPKP